MQTLQPTALIHEAYLKLAHPKSSDEEGRSFESRKQFFVLASIAMRQVLVNHAESRLAQKRGGGEHILPLQELDLAVERNAEEVLALDQAMKALHALDPRKSRVVELRYFGGLSIAETAEALGISAVTVTRDWRLARAFLYSRLERDLALVKRHDAGGFFARGRAVRSLARGWRRGAPHRPGRGLRGQLRIAARSDPAAGSGSPGRCGPILIAARGRRCVATDRRGSS